ncbi:MAG: hypothetical protein HY094_07705 [Candidatus Melainabacteria bacterium]|nr:hypothetical protein [Candidatus Melainabacteria bacterium]
MRPIIKLGAAVLASIPLATVGCTDKNADKANIVSNEPYSDIKHVSEIFCFKRDEKTGKIFIEEAEKDHRRLSYAVHNLKLLWQEIDMLKSWTNEFNKRAEKLEQREIKVSDLTPPSVLNTTKFNPKDTQTLKKFDVLNPTYFYDVYPFTNPTKGEELSSNIPVVRADGKDFSYLYTAYAAYNRNIPLSISIPSQYFIPESITRKHYLNIPRYGSSNDKELEAKEGIYFIAKGKVRKVEVIVPLTSLPLAIDTGKEMYLIGLDKVNVSNGNLGVVKR